jgi:hypothetical protein
MSDWEREKLDDDRFMACGSLLAERTVPPMIAKVMSKIGEDVKGVRNHYITFSVGRGSFREGPPMFARVMSKIADPTSHRFNRYGETYRTRSAYHRWPRCCPPLLPPGLRRDIVPGSEVEDRRDRGRLAGRRT